MINGQENVFYSFSMKFSKTDSWEKFFIIYKSFELSFNLLPIQFPSRSLIYSLLHAKNLDKKRVYELLKIIIWITYDTL